MTKKIISEQIIESCRLCKFCDAQARQHYCFYGNEPSWFALDNDKLDSIDSRCPLNDAPQKEPKNRLLYDDELSDLLKTFEDSPLVALQNAVKKQYKLTHDFYEFCLSKHDEEIRQELERHKLSNPMSIRCVNNGEMTHDIPSNEIWFAFTEDDYESFWQRRGK
jgi:hypothetical protein